jgi:hypothetical protein
LKDSSYPLTKGVLAATLKSPDKRLVAVLARQHRKQHEDHLKRGWDLKEALPRPSKR